MIQTDKLRLLFAMLAFLCVVAFPDAASSQEFETRDADEVQQDFLEFMQLHQEKLVENYTNISFNAIILPTTNGSKSSGAQTGTFLRGEHGLGEVYCEKIGGISVPTNLADLAAMALKYKNREPDNAIALFAKESFHSKKESGRFIVDYNVSENESLNSTLILAPTCNLIDRANAITTGHRHPSPWNELSDLMIELLQFDEVDLDGQAVKRLVYRGDDAPEDKVSMAYFHIRSGVLLKAIQYRKKSNGKFSKVVHEVEYQNSDKESPGRPRKITRTTFTSRASVTQSTTMLVATYFEKDSIGDPRQFASRIAAQDFGALGNVNALGNIDAFGKPVKKGFDRSKLKRKEVSPLQPLYIVLMLLAGVIGLTVTVTGVLTTMLRILGATDQAQPTEEKS